MEWASTTSGAQAVNNNDELNLSLYGRLYNWHAVDDLRGLCPSGWHVPTDGEWMMLEMELGMTIAQAYSESERGTDQGTQLKSSASDTPNWNGTNVVGFSALPGGWRDHIGFYNISGGSNAMWWSASLSDMSTPYYRLLDSGMSGVERFDYSLQSMGLSVRCVRD